MESLPLEGQAAYPTAASFPDVARAGRATDPALRARLRLQRRASGNLRRHLLRSVGRVAVLVAADLACLLVVRALLHAVRDYDVLGARVAEVVGQLFPRAVLVGVQYGAALVVALAVTGNYAPGDRRHDERRLFLACALATALPLWLMMWSRGVGPVLVQYALTTAGMWVVLVAERLNIERAVTRALPARNRLDALFVGSGSDCFAALQTPAFTAQRDYRPIGFVDTRMPLAAGALGGVGDFAILLAASGAQAVVICGHVTDRQFQQVVDTALTAGCQVLSVPRSVKIAGVHPRTVWRGGQPLVELTAPSLKGWQLAVKRGADVVGAAAGLALVSPLIALIAAIVKVESPGPAFFTQERVGRGGRRFRIVKFRTMADGAERHRDELLGQSLYRDARLFKVPNDPRITQVGRFLRRTSLDELPQLVNVLRGDMSLVGPRPPLPSEVALYEAHHYARFDVKPGMTGPWQVQGRSGVTSFDDVVALETSYIRNWSVWADLVLLVRTIPAVLRMRGAL